MRKITNLVTMPASESNYLTLFAVCDDGAVFYQVYRSLSDLPITTKWCKLPLPPQEKGDEQ